MTNQSPDHGVLTQLLHSHPGFFQYFINTTPISGFPKFTKEHLNCLRDVRPATLTPSNSLYHKQQSSSLLNQRSLFLFCEVTDMVITWGKKFYLQSIPDVQLLLPLPLWLPFQNAFFFILTFLYCRHFFSPSATEQFQFIDLVHLTVRKLRYSVFWIAGADVSYFTTH